MVQIFLHFAVKIASEKGVSTKSASNLLSSRMSNRPPENFASRGATDSSGQKWKASEPLGSSSFRQAKLAAKKQDKVSSNSSSDHVAQRLRPRK